MKTISAFSLSRRSATILANWSRNSALDENRQVIGRNRILRGAMPFLRKPAMMFALAVTSTLHRRRLQKPAVQSTYFAMSYGPCSSPASPEAAQKATIASATCFSESFLYVFWKTPSEMIEPVAVPSAWQIRHAIR